MPKPSNVIAGIPGVHERVFIGPRSKWQTRAWVNGPVAGIAAFANPLLKRDAITHLPLGDSLSKFFSSISINANGTCKALKVKVVKAFLNAWGDRTRWNEFISSGFVRAYASTSSNLEQEIDARVFYNQIKSPVFLQWCRTVLDVLSTHRDHVIGVYVFSGVHPRSLLESNNGPLTAAQLKREGAMVRVDPQMFAFRTHLKRTYCTSHHSGIMHILREVDKSNSARPMGLDGSFAQRLFSAFMYAKVNPIRNKMCIADLSYYGRAAIDAGSKVLQKKLAWGVYKHSDIDDKLPARHLGGLFITHGSEMFSTALIWVLFALKSGALKIVLYPTTHSYVPGLIKHNNGDRCTWNDDLTEPLIRRTKHMSFIYERAFSDVTWGGIRHAMERGVRKIYIAGSTYDILSRGQESSSVWMELLYYHKIIKLSGLTVFSTLLNTSRSTIELSDERMAIINAEVALVAGKSPTFGPVLHRCSARLGVALQLVDAIAQPDPSLDILPVP